MSRSPADREWFEGVVSEVLPDLFGSTLRLTRNHLDTEDLVAESVARGWAQPRLARGSNAPPGLALLHSR